MTANGKTFTPTESRMLEVLSDGKVHLRKELFDCLWDNDPQASRSNVNRHISSIRTKIKPIGGLIVCELVRRNIGYRHVKTL